MEPAGGRATRPAYGFAALAALALTAFSFVLQARYGFGAADEGYLWYGAQRTLRGEVPIRDFMAYDIGRYYWSAAWMHALGRDGELALRAAAAAFQALGMVAGAACVARAGLRAAAIVAACLLLLVWMWPWFRVFDCAVAMALVAALAWLVEAPRPARAFGAGVAVGMAALVGRNHGLYGGLALLAVLALVPVAAGAGRGRNLLAASAGVVAGYAPMLAMLLVDAGFRAAFIADNLELFASGATNIALPVPWPHRAFATAGGGWETARAFVLGLYFVALPVFTVLGAWKLARSGRRQWHRSPVLVAAVLLSVPYAHFAFSRADLSHMASGIWPLLLGAIAWPAATPRAARVRGAVLGVLLATSLVLLLPRHPGFAGRLAPDWVDHDVAGERLRMAPGTAAQLDRVAGELADARVGSGQVLITPHWVGMYPAFGLRSPVWEIYALTPRDEAFQRAEIARIEAAGVRLALVQDKALDGRDDLRYRNTHALVYAHLQENFDLVDTTGGVQVFRRRDGMPR